MLALIFPGGFDNNRMWYESVRFYIVWSAVIIAHPGNQFLGYALVECGDITNSGVLSGLPGMAFVGTLLP